MEGTPIHELKINPANYAGPIRMLDGADVPEGGPLASYEKTQRIANLFRLNANRWGILADRVGLTEAQADAILAHGRSGMVLASNIPSMVTAY